MKELTSEHDDLEKRLAIFFGLGALILSALIGLMRGYSLEGILFRGVLVLILATAGAWLFGAWLKAALKSSAPAEEPVLGIERRSVVPAVLEDSHVVSAPRPEDAVTVDEVHEPLAPAMRNFVLPDLNPAEEAALQAIAAGGSGGAEAAPAAPAEAAKAPAKK